VRTIEERYTMTRAKQAMLARIRKPAQSLKAQAGKMGYILLWALGIPIPVLFVIYLLRGCT
jgi:hypothetical protein